MFASFLTDHATKAVPLIPLNKVHFDSWSLEQDPSTIQWLKAVNFTADAGQIVMVPGPSGQVKLALVGVDGNNSLWSLADCPKILAAGPYQLDDKFSLLDAEQAALGWGLACYKFDRYASAKTTFDRQLVLPTELLNKVTPILEACFWVRNLITTPAEDMGPEQLALEAKKLAEQYHANYRNIVGKELLEQGYAGIYTVGRAAAEAPRLIDIKWGQSNHPKLTLVGKGVCFDSGGLDLKPADNMLLMRKDMGGAAHVLGLAKLIMAAKLPVQLRVLVPAVENAVSKDSFRPGDIVTARNGKTIEIGNTDAEGRVILADALVEASQDQPELIIDFATLTGAARVALGSSLPALFSNDAQVAHEVIAAGLEVHDPLWQLPLHAPYKRFIKGKFADLTNNPGTAMGGAITAALFLECFVGNNIPWMHIDLMAWNDSNQPGRPEGGEAMGMRAMFAYLLKRYGH